MANNNETPTGLYWQGKKTEIERVSLPFQTIETINESRATRQKEKIRGADVFKADELPVDDWHNRLVWGDNKYVMSSLLDEFAGKIDLIYIDPPFASGSDFSVKVEIGEYELEKAPSAMEDKAYRDTWGKGLDSYLQMMYERLLLMRELMASNGTIYVHLDWHVGHYVKVILDDIFGESNFLNEIVWYYYNKMHDIRKPIFPRAHDVILSYAKSRNPGRVFHQLKEKREKPTTQLVRKKVDGRMVNARDEEGNILYRETDERNVDDVWRIPMLQPADKTQNTGFVTQKNELILERIIRSSSNDGAIVGDFFCGSGTTGAVAEKLGRRWIMADLSRYAIHISRKRLLDIDGCKPFVVQNLGKYERQIWQGVTFKKRSDEQIPLHEYLEFILKLYKAEPLSGMVWIHGKRGKRLVHVGAVDAPVTLSDIQSAMDECKKLKQEALDILGWEWELGLHDVVEKAAKEKGISLSLKYIPRDVMDPRAVESGEITFYELAYLEASVAKNKQGEVVVKLEDFVIPNHDMIPDEVRQQIKKWSDYIDYWAVDWDFNEDTFHNMWQTYRTRKDRTLELKTDPHTYEKKGKHKILIKVIDIFGNDTTRLEEVTA